MAFCARPWEPAGNYVNITPRRFYRYSPGFYGYSPGINHSRMNGVMVRSIVLLPIIIIGSSIACRGRKLISLPSLLQSVLVLSERYNIRI